MNTPRESFAYFQRLVRIIADTSSDMVRLNTIIDQRHFDQLRAKLKDAERALDNAEKFVCG